MMATKARILTLSHRIIISGIWSSIFIFLSFPMKITGQGIGEKACPSSVMELLTYDALVSFKIFRAMQPLIADIILFRTDSNLVCRFEGNEAPNIMLEVHATLKQVIIELSRPKEKDYIIFHDALRDVPYLVVRDPSGNIVGVHRRLNGRYAQEYYKEHGLVWEDTKNPTVFEFRSTQLIANVEASKPLVDALRARVSGNDHPIEAPAPELLWHLIYHLERVRGKLNSGQYDYYLSQLKGSPPNYREYMQLVFELLKNGTDMPEDFISRNSKALPRLLERFPRQILWPSYKARISPQRFLKALLYGILPIALETEHTTLHASPKKLDPLAVALHDLVHYWQMMKGGGFRVLEIVNRICSSTGTEICLGQELDPDLVAPAYWVIHERSNGLNFDPLGVSFDSQFLPSSLDDWNQVRKPSPHMPSPVEIDQFKENLKRLLVIINLAEHRRLADVHKKKAAENKARAQIKNQMQYVTQHFRGVLHNPPADGFCFWHVLAHALNNGQNAQNLQQQVLAFLNSIVEALDGGGVLTGVQQQFLDSTGLNGPGLSALILAQQVDEEDFEQRRSLRTLPWATDQMIQAAALLFGVIIHVTSFPNPDTNQPVQQAFQPYELSASVQSVYVANVALGTHFVQTGPRFSLMDRPQAFSLYLQRMFCRVSAVFLQALICTGFFKGDLLIR